MVPAIFISILMTGIPIPQIGFGAELTEAFGGGYLLDRLDGMSQNWASPSTRRDNAVRRMYSLSLPH